jgi:N-methylhydantoinase A
VGDFTDTPVFARSGLGPDAVLDGPAIVEQMDTTVLIPPSSRARVDARLNLIIDVEAGAGQSSVFAAAEPITGGI